MRFPFIHLLFTIDDLPFGLAPDATIGGNKNSKSDLHNKSYIINRRFFQPIATPIALLVLSLFTVINFMFASYIRETMIMFTSSSISFTFEASS